MSKAMFRVAIAGLCICSMSATAGNLQNGPTLENQYKTIVEEANNYQEYKVIKESTLRSLFKNAKDSLMYERKSSVTAKATIAQQLVKLEELKTALSKQGHDLQQTQTKIDSISLLGINLSKKSYSNLMWSMLLVLAAISVFCVFRVKGFKKEASYRINLFEDLTVEFKNYKKNAIDKEMRLARELQTERNRMEEMRVA
jgi:preprotein translocase subunit SecF